MKTRTARTLLAALGMLLLNACGGGGGGGSTPPPTGPGPTNPPAPGYSVGPTAINGIDRIPQSMVKLTREQMQPKVVIADVEEEHAQQVGTIACESYIQSGDCESQAGRFINADGTIRTETGSSPFTKVVSLSMSDTANLPVMREIAKMPEVKIVIWPVAGNAAADNISDSYLTVHSVGNGADNPLWYDNWTSPGDRVKIAAAIREHRLIYAAGWIRDASGNYTRHPHSYSCREDEIREGCVWTQFDFRYGGGTSYSAPQFAAALASVLAIAPDTTPQNLAKFGKACVLKTGNGIEEMLRVSGGLGVADFACVGDVVTAMANLPGGGTANVIVNGQPVTLSGRDIVLSFAGGFPDVPLEAESRDGPFFTVVPNGEATALTVAGYRQGDLFVALTGGTRDDFFGFAKEHRNIRQMGVAAGHEKLFLALAEQRSRGGGIITAAKGQSLTVKAQESFSLTGKTALTLTAVADRFLGGEASIPLGSVRLGGGDWQPRLSLAMESEILPAMSFRTQAEMTGQEDYAVSAGIRLTF